MNKINFWARDDPIKPGILGKEAEGE